MDKNRQDSANNNLVTTENKLWLPPSYTNGKTPVIPKLKKREINWGFANKSFWDWIQFFAVLALPIIVAAGTLYFTQQITLQQTLASEKQHQTDIQIALDQQRETALSNYISDMQNLLLNYGLHNSKPNDEIRQIARTQTLLTLRKLDPNRKASLLLFLYEAKLIDSTNPIIDLNEADLSGVILKAADLHGANLAGANLDGALLNDADLSMANLSGTQMVNANLDHDYSKPISFGVELAPINNTDLSGANLTNANLSDAHLFEVIFSGANLYEANLSRAYLVGSGFDNADLSSAQLSEANLSGVQLSTARLHFTGLFGTNLSSADLSGDDLSNSTLYTANLNKANLKGCTGITTEELEKQAKSLHGTIMPDGSIHP